tara:strand:- start:650 stop:1099 length:450 start_codon:yes stop_codon:yes gene_type:complete
MSNVNTNKFGGALLFILGEFADADEEMIVDGGMEVFGEDDQGREGSCEVSINELAQAAFDEINYLTDQLAKANERLKVLEREAAQKKHHFVGYSNGFQIAYAKHDEGCFYPSTDGDSYIPLYMLDVHLHRLGGTASDEWAKKLSKEQDQ